MNHFRTTGILCLSIICTGIAVQAQIGGQSVYRFLNLNGPARVAGMGGNPISHMDDDLVFATRNPALLTEDMHGQISVSGVSAPSGIGFGEAYYAHTFEGVGNFYSGIKYVNYGNFVRSDFNGNITGTFTAGDYAWLTGYSYQLDTNWTFGGTMKLINSVLETYSSWGLAFDFAASYKIPHKRLNFTLVTRNLGFQLSPYQDERESLPFEILLGVSNRFEHMPFRWMITLENLQQYDLRYRDPNRLSRDPFTRREEYDEASVWNNLVRHLNLAAEFTPTSGFQAQVGYSFRRSMELDVPTRRTSAGLSFGVGLKLSKFFLNYAQSIYHVAGTLHHFSVTTSLGEFRKKEEEPGK